MSADMGRALLILGFALTVPAANWLIGNVGWFCEPGPCRIPVGWGLMAPSGVLMVGLALVLRDAVHEVAGVAGALLAITLGAVLSLLVSPPELAIASVSAFVIAELADTMVYEPLRRRGRSLAVLVSGLVGAAVDSAVFLYVAFGSLDFLAGNTLGKVYWTVLVAAILAVRERSR